MPWCPNCKTEYQPGVTRCADCKVELVDSLEETVIYIPFFQSEQKKIAQKLASFFEYSDLDSTIKYDEDNDMYIVCIDPAMYKEAKKLYQAFYFVERERMEKGESDLFTPDDIANESSEDGDEHEDTRDDAIEPSEDVLSEAEDGETGTEDSSDESSGDEDNVFDEEDEDTSTYVMKADQYKDLTGTVWIFLIFGIGGLVFVLLNVLGILSIFNGWVPNTVMGALFLLFIYIALSTNQKAKKIQVEIDAENKLTEEINAWLKKNVTEDFLSSISDETVSKELNYLRQTDVIKELLIKEFGNQNLSYLDRLIEEFYIATFDETDGE